MISVCIIVKDDARNLEECLKRLKAYPVEIVVVDTGSSDDSRKVAESYTDSVYDFAWCDDFSAARNYAAEKAANDYIIAIDSDEYIDSLKMSQLKKMLAEHPAEVGAINIVNEGKDNKVQGFVPRVYHRRNCRFEGRIHEQIRKIDGSNAQAYVAPIQVLHTGYAGTPEKLQEKWERNIRLLRTAISNGEATPYNFYQLGRAYFNNKRYQHAIVCFEKVLAKDVNPKLDYVIDCIESYGWALLYSGQTANALSLAAVYDLFQESADYVFLMGIIYLENDQFENALNEFTKVQKYPRSNVIGRTTYQAHYFCGVCYEQMGKLNEAVKEYKKCGKYEPAIEAVKRIKSEMW